MIAERSSVKIHSHGKTSTSLLLPPANEVWGKVMYVFTGVCLSTGGGVPTSLEGAGGIPIGRRRVCLQGGMGSAYRGRGSAYSGGWADPPQTRKAGSTYPTGMFSCSYEHYN